MHSVNIKGITDQFLSAAKIFYKIFLATSTYDHHQPFKQRRIRTTQQRLLAQQHCTHNPLSTSDQVLTIKQVLTIYQVLTIDSELAVPIPTTKYLKDKIAYIQVLLINHMLTYSNHSLEAIILNQNTVPSTLSRCYKRHVIETLMHIIENVQ